MIGVIIGSRKIGINPDNVATPIAASLGDLITLALLSGISWGLYLEQGEAGVTEDATRVDSWVGLGDKAAVSHTCKGFSCVPNHLVGTQFVDNSLPYRGEAEFLSQIHAGSRRRGESISEIRLVLWILTPLGGGRGKGQRKGTKAGICLHNEREEMELFPGIKARNLASGLCP